MGFLETIKNIGNGAIFNIAIPNSEGILFTNSSYNSSNIQQFASSSQAILSNYTLITKTGDSYFHAIIKDNGIETEYSINTGSSPNTSIITRYDPSDNQPAFIYYDYRNPYNYLYYIKLNQGVWSGTEIANIGPSENKNAIDFEYDPNDNLPACIAYDSAGYDLNYYKFNGASFVKTTILNGGSSANNVDYASLSFDTSDNYPMVNFIEGNSSIFKSAKYNGTSWTTSSINTFESSYNKKYIATKFSPTNQPIVLIGGATSGIFINVKDSSNVWKSGKFMTNQDVIYQKPEIDISLDDQNDVYISYVDNENKLVFIEKNLIGLIDVNWSSNLDDFIPKKINLLSGSEYLDINKNIYLEIDSDFQPVVFYKKNNAIKYIKNTGNINNLSSTSFSGQVNFKNINNSANYNYDLEFFKDTFNVYQTAGRSFYEYKNLYTSTEIFEQDNLLTIYSSDIKINPITNQPNIVLFGNISPNIRFYYPDNPQRTSWSKLSLPSGNIFFSGTNLPAVLSASNNCRFDFDRNTNEAIISCFGFRGGGSSGRAFLIKKDLEGSGYQYYHVPYTGYYLANSDFKVNPITNKYCLAISNYATQNFETGLIYFEMDSINNSWTKTQVELKTSQANKIYLDFASGGYPVISYLSQSGTVGLLKLAKYNGTNWTTNIIDSGSNTNNFYFNSFQYNSGEDYYGISYKSFSSSNSGFYISNKGGTTQKYNLGNQSNASRIPYLIFKNYKNEVRPFVFMDPSTSQYNYFYYLDNESFITGKFKNTLPNDGQGNIILKV